MRIARSPLLAGLACLLFACGRSSELPLNALLITVDTTNRATLGCYGKRTGITPNLDAFAEQSLVYDNARTVAPLTLPSHSSMMTGLYPPRHTVRENGLRALPGSAVTVAERASDRGYQTAAFVSAMVLAAPYGLDQGFEVYDGPATTGRGGLGHFLERPGSEVTTRAVKWLEQRDALRPFFLWVHYFDPHAPYEPQPEFLERVREAGGARFPEYLAEVAQTDAAIGELLSALEREQLTSRTLVSIVADHGESLYRHEEPTHSLFIYDATIRVPLLLRYPDGYRAGERSDEVVSVVDLAPTFFEALDLAPPEAIDGQSLYRRELSASRGVYFESSYGYLNYGWSPLSGWADARGVYLHSSDPELFLGAPGSAGTDCFTKDDALAAELRAKIAQVASQAALPSNGESVDEALLADLQALGYAGGSDAAQAVPGPLQVDGLPSPREHVEEMVTFYEATLLAASGQVEQGVQLLRKLLDEQPGSLLAAEMLASILNREERFTETVELLTPSYENGALRRPGLALLGHAQEELGELEAALEVYLGAYQLLPGDGATIQSVKRVLHGLGREEQAASFPSR